MGEERRQLLVRLGSQEIEPSANHPTPYPPDGLEYWAKEFLSNRPMLLIFIQSQPMDMDHEKHYG